MIYSMCWLLYCCLVLYCVSSTSVCSRTRTYLWKLVNVVHNVWPRSAQKEICSTKLVQHLTYVCCCRNSMLRKEHDVMFCYHIYIVPLEMKGFICHLVKWWIHPFISKGTIYRMHFSRETTFKCDTTCTRPLNVCTICTRTLSVVRQVQEDYNFECGTPCTQPLNRWAVMIRWENVVGAHTCRVGSAEW